MAFNLKNFVASVAPTLATMLGTPMAGAAVLALEQALGLQPGAGEQGITQAVQAGSVTTDQLAAIRAADQAHKEKLSQLGVDLEQMAAADRDSARKMQIAQPSHWPGILSFITTAAVLGVIGAHMFGAQLPSDTTFVQLVGSLTTGWGLALSYWFGTTRGSGNKDALLAQSQPVADK